MDGYFSEYYLNDNPDLDSQPPGHSYSPAPESDIDFSLTLGGTISGFVYEEGTTTPIYGARVIAYDSTTELIVDDAWSRDGSYVSATTSTTVTTRWRQRPRLLQRVLRQRHGLAAGHSR
jgi:hypothetical protein